MFPSDYFEDNPLYAKAMNILYASGTFLSLVLLLMYTTTRPDEPDIELLYAVAALLLITGLERVYQLGIFKILFMTAIMGVSAAVGYAAYLHPGMGVLSQIVLVASVSLPMLAFCLAGELGMKLMEIIMNKIIALFENDEPPEKRKNDDLPVQTHDEFVTDADNFLDEVGDYLRQESVVIVPERLEATR